MPENNYWDHSPKPLNGHAVHASLEEVRSEEVQEIMGKMPPWIIRSGITLIGVLIAGAFVWAGYFRYPDVLPLQVRITTDAQAPVVQGNIPAGDAWRVKAGQPVMLRLAAYPADTYGLLPGTVTTEAIAVSDSSFRVDIRLTQGMRSTTGREIPSQSVLTGTAEIMTADQSVLQRVMGQVLAPLTKR
ncbi:putative HlyD family type I secretion protein [Chitinophaga flava]|uniref:HlyD family secretion protein n=1 Tax=Chitinophaga flava TaxID=2259036 RepID=A0A365XT91_9BACT|nr:hypothetical protein [Chitinophaga flava]RBL89553.1 hypothetical protein DF182_23885 [Chitinophaga flava]